MENKAHNAMKIARHGDTRACIFFAQDRTRLPLHCIRSELSAGLAPRQFIHQHGCAIRHSF
uniref:Uncharacterized protein n=1 Tax=uncultured alpha proteobacterium HF0130_06E21 TaxID=710808 RepID=E0XT13_9PROT|nr:hypothetical protein [uncultured alpha proteobacterium HF0130_06E21]